MEKMIIGVLAIQGAVSEHMEILRKLKVQGREVRNSHHLEGLSGIILPGGESTVHAKLLRRFGIFEPLKEKIIKGLPVWGTCTGAILLAKHVTGKNPPETFSLMGISAERNAYGSHLDSFTTDLTVYFRDHIHGDEKKTIKAVFIRAPKLSKTSGSNVQIFAEYEGVPVMLREGHLLVTTFHPELTGDTSVHKYFLGMCE